MSAIKAIFQIESMAWTFILAAALWLNVIWMIRKGDTMERAWRGLARVHQELWIAVPIGVMFNAVEDWHGAQFFNLFFDALTLFNWLYFRNWPEDNNWKRRAKKAKEAVAERAGRLVVVPVGAES